MDLKDLSERMKVLKKAVENDPPTTVVGLLRSLKDAAAPGEDALRVSRPRVTGPDPADPLIHG